MDSDMGSAEFAVLVEDKYHGKGIGYRLPDFLVGFGQHKGLERIYGEVLTENLKMLTVCRRLGFTAKMVPGGTTQVRLKLK